MATALGGVLNQWMQHLISDYREEAVADKAASKDLLHTETEDVDVGPRAGTAKLAHFRITSALNATPGRLSRHRPNSLHSAFDRHCPNNWSGHVVCH